jgi:hypothetical protein
LILVAEIEPTETAFFSVGSSVRVHLACFDADTKQYTNPDQLQFVFTAPWTAPVTSTFGVGGEIVQDAVGLFHADTPLALAGQNTFQYLAQLNSVACGSNSTEVYAW